ncbi:hypothetical protein RYX36_032337 [Vicia faba]
MMNDVFWSVMVKIHRDIFFIFTTQTRRSTSSLITVIESAPPSPFSRRLSPRGHRDLPSKFDFASFFNLRRELSPLRSHSRRLRPPPTRLQPNTKQTGSVRKFSYSVMIFCYESIRFLYGLFELEEWWRLWSKAWQEMDLKKEE